MFWTLAGWITRCMPESLGCTSWANTQIPVLEGKPSFLKAAYEAPSPPHVKPHPCWHSLLSASVRTHGAWPGLTDFQISGICFFFYFSHASPIWGHFCVPFSVPPHLPLAALHNSLSYDCLLAMSLLTLHTLRGQSSVSLVGCCILRVQRIAWYPNTSWLSNSINECPQCWDIFW